ncbi:hypothetical protein Asulf_01928 [Archaeoglobus sulfaticallidus PM70-1]|uniref:DDH domain-containing protein n=1 Tax=Archaeoglobus sulfaticallidus PM70-1 TaxID=387631 RepID=N0BE42_9EURY|nr:DHH family phosphoesterase [Archaeoglobus sulfaticallidus]AGK61894.1 hypothetical protein Asulf_01928 [Archaeoglobus sulfaticallidus PM70-1]
MSALIIHHWDTDGVASAALVVKALDETSDFRNLVPPIGKFRLDERIKKYMANAEKLFILDLNLPDEVEALDRDAVFIDHHIQPKIKNSRIRQINPVLDGKTSPSTTFVVSEYYNLWNAWSALGAIGDVGRRAFEIQRVIELLKKEGITRNEAEKIVELIDSNYIVMDRNKVEDAVKVLLEKSLTELLEFEPWLNNLEAIESEIDNVLSNVVVEDGLALAEFSSDFNIISKVARKLVWELGYNGAVAVNRNFHGKAQLYFRVSPDMAERVKMDEIISSLKDFNAGGKKDVFGCVCERDRLNDVLEILMGCLKCVRFS